MLVHSHKNKLQLDANEKEIISRLALNFKRNIKVRNMQKKYLNSNKTGDYKYSFSFTNLEPNINYDFVMKYMDDRYTLLFNKFSTEEGIMDPFSVQVPPCCKGESYEFVLIPRTKRIEFIVHSIFVNPIIKEIDNKIVTLDMVLPKGLLWSCYGENFKPNTIINVISFSGIEMISKKYNVNDEGKFIFLITPFRSRKDNISDEKNSRIKLITQNKEHVFELFYEYGTQCKPI